MSRLVTIYGGSGFVGRYIARRMAALGWRVRVACRHPNDALFVRTYGVVGQVEPVFCNIRDDDSVRAAMAGADAVANCVGTFDEGGRNNFQAVQAEGAERIARLAAAQDVAHLVHVSAIGADPDSRSEYARTKAAGETSVRGHFPTAVILRPSIIFGPEDRFFNRFAGMARLGPVLPLIGAETRFQPVYVDDVALAAVKGLTGEAAAGIYELGGPEVETFRGLVNGMLETVRRRRLVWGMPFWLGRIFARGFSLANRLTLGILPLPVTPDQVRSLAYDNVVAKGAKGFAELGISPTAIEAVVPSYLWRFRPSGQYAAIKESAAQPATLTLQDQSLLVAALLGVIEGLTEFIPVSSTGHILLAGHFLGFHSTGKAFEVLIQLGAILAILSVYAGRLLKLARDFPTDARTRRFVVGVLLAFLPAVVLGVALHGIIKTVLFETPALVATMLVLGGIVLLWVDRRPERPRYRDVMDFPLPVAFGIGLFQCLALVPGVSRSGSTIVGALLLGTDKRSAAEFSFFLSMPTMAGAFAYDLFRNRDVLSMDDAAVIAVGFVCAFVAAVLVVRRLLDFVSRHGFAVFGWWRIVVGSLALIALWMGSGTV